ncbi:hypothetical protein ACHAWF_007231, partial [Thalassiosira exigua]
SDRASHGQCPTCGIQTHKVKSAGILGGKKRLPPLTNDDVRRGRCLQCNGARSDADDQAGRGAPAVEFHSEDFSEGDDLSELSHDRKTIPKWLLFLEVLACVVTIVGLPLALYEALKKDEGSNTVVIVEAGGGVPLLTTSDRINFFDEATFLGGVFPRRLVADDGSPRPAPAPTPAPTGRPRPDACTSSLNFVGPLLESDCTCFPSLAAREGAAAVAIGGEGVRFFSKGDDGGDFLASNAFDKAAPSLVVATPGDFAAAGAPDKSDGIGAAYVYERDPAGSWYERARIAPDDLVEGALFGTSVNVDGDVIVVGAPSVREFEGTTHVFRRMGGGSWVREAKLSPPEVLKSGDFGSSVSVWGDAIAVPDPSYDTGAVFVYRNPDSTNDWVQMGPPLTGECDQSFGSGATLMHDNGMIVGCAGGAGSRGSVYYYQLSTAMSYDLKQEITPSGDASMTSFGGEGRLVVDGDIMAIGTGDQNNGSVYVFKLMALGSKQL